MDEMEKPDVSTLLKLRRTDGGGHERRARALEAMPEREREILRRQAERLADALPNVGKKSALELLEALGALMRTWDEEVIRYLEVNDVQTAAQN